MLQKTAEGADLEHDGWTVLLDVHSRPSALEATAGVVNEAWLGGVRQPGFGAWHPAQ